MTKFGDMMEKGAEAEVFMAINTMGFLQWKLTHDAGDGRIPDGPDIDKALSDIHEQMLIALRALKRFGVDASDKDGKPTDDYWSWYRWWKGWLDALSEDEWLAMDRKIQAGEDISSYRPKGDWRKP